MKSKTKIPFSPYKQGINSTNQMWFPSWSREQSCGRKRKDFPSARVQVSSRLLCVEYQEDPDTRGADAWKCQQQSFLSEFSVFRKVVEATGTCILFCIFFWPQKGAVHIPLKFCMVFFVLFSSLWKFPSLYLINNQSWFPFVSYFNLENTFLFSVL